MLLACAGRGLRGRPIRATATGVALPGHTRTPVADQPPGLKLPSLVARGGRSYVSNYLVGKRSKPQAKSAIGQARDVTDETMEAIN